MRSAVVGGKEVSRPIVVGGEEVSRPALVGGGSGGCSACLNGRLSPSDRGVRGAALSSSGVLYVDLSAAASGSLVSTPSSAIGANSIDEVRRLGWSGDVGGCEGASLVNGREDEVGHQFSSAVADGQRSLNGSENKVLNPFYSINGATRQVDGSFVSREFNRVPLVSFGGTGSQPRALLDINVSRESYVPLSRSIDSAVQYGSRLNRLKNDNFEAARMWSIGKELGFSFIGDEEIIISKLKPLEN
ncbi:hypothetical protein PHAVU_010G029050 [Phaseolus vulgaris]